LLFARLCAGIGSALDTTARAFLSVKCIQVRSKVGPIPALERKLSETVVVNVSESVNRIFVSFLRILIDLPVMSAR